MNLNTAYQHMLETADVLGDIDQEPIEKTIEILRKAKKDGNQVFLFGNGGSHSNASHMANDLLKACGIKAICISDMTPSVYAYNNDNGRDFMFALPMLQLFQMEDIIMAFSCSGRSDNITGALFGGNGYKKILLTGDKHGPAASFVETVIKVPHPNIRIQESCHSAICHAIVEALLSE